MADLLARTTSGVARGFAEEGQLVFLGLPYAAPPVGDRRFAPPAPPEAWDGVRDALRYGPTAPQREQGWTIIPEPTESGDDYLNANVYTPDLGDARLPVLVWIHGGGFNAGCNRSPWYRGTRFARDGIVCVTVNYRLGPEAFLEMDGAPSNRAMLDWIAALRWVQDNVAAFGGDPSNVTIAGQSAGSAACVFLLAAGEARGLFRRAICQSGVADTGMTADTARDLAGKVAANLGARPVRDELARFAPADIIAAHAALDLGPTTDRAAPQFKPFVDGEVVTGPPLRAIRDGAGNDVDLVCGATRHEINALSMRIAPDDDAALRMLERYGLDPEARRRYAEHLGVEDHTTIVGQAMTDYAFRVPVAKLLDARSGARARTFGYDFRWPSPVGAVGACHCLDIPFAFDNLDAERVRDGLHGPNPPQALADLMHLAWVRFCTEGDPGWPPHEPGRRAMMAFEDESTVLDDPLAVERELFARPRPAARR